jgi:hypothetical protein
MNLEELQCGGGLSPALDDSLEERGDRVPEVEDPMVEVVHLHCEVRAASLLHSHLPGAGKYLINRLRLWQECPPARCG